MKTIETRVYFWSVSLCWSLKRSILMLKIERKPEAQIKKNTCATERCQVRNWTSLKACMWGVCNGRRVKGIISHERYCYATLLERTDFGLFTYMPDSTH